MPAKPGTLLIVTRQPQATLKSAIWEKIQAKWQWEHYDSVVIKQVSPALPFSAHTGSLVWRLSKRFYYLWRKSILAFFIVWQIGRYEGVVLETLFSYKGELFLEELFLGCFQKTVLDVSQIQQEVQQLNETAHYDLDLVALDQKIKRLQTHFNVYWINEID